jgi:hypothetical protein
MPEKREQHLTPSSPSPTHLQPPIETQAPIETPKDTRTRIATTGIQSDSDFMDLCLATLSEFLQDDEINPKRANVAAKFGGLALTLVTIRQRTQIQRKLSLLKPEQAIENHP